MSVHSKGRASAVCVAPERLVAGQAALLENVIEELTAVHVLHDNKQVPSRLPHIMQLHHTYCRLLKPAEQLSQKALPLNG